VFREGNYKGKQKPKRPDVDVWVPVEGNRGPDAPRRGSVQPFSFDWLALKFLESWTPDDLAMAIRSGAVLDLSLFIDLIEGIVVESVLNWFRERRPDLYAVLATEEGVAWLKRNVRLALRGR